MELLEVVEKRECGEEEGSSQKSGHQWTYLWLDARFTVESVVSRAPLSGMTKTNIIQHIGRFALTLWDVSDNIPVTVRCILRVHY